MKLIIISNRLPLKIVEEQSKYKVIPSPGGLSTGLDSLETTLDKHWIGWPGMYLEEGPEKEDIDRQLEEHKYHPVYLTPQQIEDYYEGYSNSILWPLCHYFFNYVHYDNAYWLAYQQVNALFCEAAMQVIRPGDIVWVQGYQLMLLPGMIRNQAPDISIGYFLHIPFPSYELFRGLPERAELLNGLLGADLIGFHTYDYMRHFISTVYRVLKLDCYLDEIQLDRRVVDVDAFPMGINYEMYHNAIRDPATAKKAEELRDDFGTGKLILSVDRLDYSKGILLRLESYENFLKNHPEYRGKVSLVMVVSPSRDTVDIYANLKEEIDKKVGAINGKYSTIDWSPVYYFYRSFTFEELAALYYIADVALVTPIRDGMNLVSKEFLAVKRTRPGVLILSEMAGAANELREAIIVNPTDTHEIEEALVTALAMPVKEQKRRMKVMQEIISTQTVKQWATDFISELQGVRKKNQELRQKLVEDKNFAVICKMYDAAKKRLLILDYDGTLVKFVNNPKAASPPADLLRLLEVLAEDPKNDVVISSGRDRKTLEKWLGKLPVGLSAEHGAFYKEKGEWHARTQRMEWDKEIVDIIRNAVKRTPGSRMEVKDTALVWHYRDVDSWLADLRITQLLNALINPCSRLNLQIMNGNKILEIKQSEFSKGSEALRLMKKDAYDLILAVGDDATDEEMFATLPKEAITIKVGKCSATAMYNISTQEETVQFLNLLAGVERQVAHAN